MQPAVQEFVELGRLPDSADASVKDLQRCEEILGRIRTPLTNDEARALKACFGTDDCFGLAWSLLHAIETAPNWPLADVLGNADNEWIGAPTRAVIHLAQALPMAHSGHTQTVATDRFRHTLSYNRAMTSTGTDSFVLRDLNEDDAADLEWVATGMHLTLVEVEGEKGRQEYPIAWTRTRLRELLEPTRPYPAHVYLAVAKDDPTRIVGHTILRINAMPDGLLYGLVSTTYVDPAHRRSGIADLLLERGEAWIRERGMLEAATWTSATNLRLVRLYEKHGYAVTERAPHESGTMMVRLTKALEAA